MQNRLPKTRRAPGLLRPQRITALDLKVLALVERYRFLPTHLIQALLPNNPKVTARHLQKLYHESLVNRFALPRPGAPGEFIYYLDSAKALMFLVEGNGTRKSQLDQRRIRSNREARYFEINQPGKAEEAVGRLPFIHHELMISRFHASLELACQTTAGKVALVEWRQGRSQLRSSVEASKVFQRRGQWFEDERHERLPHEPDAFFRLRFADASGRNTDRSFFYEADRKRTSVRRFARKLRAHWHFIVAQKKHREKYGVERIRAVLTETLDSASAERLREASLHPMVSGGKPSSLFWFTTSALLEKRGAVFRPVWFSPVDDDPRSLLE